MQRCGCPRRRLRPATLQLCSQPRWMLPSQLCRTLCVTSASAGRRSQFSGTLRMSTAVVPDRARVVVVGGGIIGTSVAYHLAHMGCRDVLLLEKNKLTSGTTWHAAGLVCTYGSLSETSTEFRKYTKKLYQTLEAETGQSTGFLPCGFIELATSADRLQEYRRVAAFNRKCGVDVNEISPAEVERLFPLCRTDDVLAGFYIQDDGRVNPVDATMALAKGARMQGATLLEDVEVTGVTSVAGRVTGVATAQGHIEAEYVVNCAGMWARQLGQLSGVTIPNQAAEHYYLLTEPIAAVDPGWPVVEDPSSHTYIRPEGGGLMVGMFEPEAASWMVPKVPDGAYFDLEPDWERMAPFLEKAMNRVPASLTAGVSKLFCGPESFTPDLGPAVGESPELQNYFVAAGLNSVGILTGGGIGRLTAQWILDGVPDMDVTGINVNRFHKYQANRSYRGVRVEEALGKVYKCHYPSASFETARGIKRSPLHDALKSQGAYFLDVSGWESPGWFAGAGQTPKIEEYSWGRENWFPIWEAEHMACRNDVALIDMSFMSKFLVQGEGAGRLLNSLSTANVDGDSELTTYTQWLNVHGRLEADLTVTKLANDRFMVVATDTMHRHVEMRMQRAARNTHVTVTDVTGAYSMLNVQGPRSRELMAQVTSADLGGEAFPFRTARDIDVGHARALCQRITYVGELGFELYAPAEMTGYVYEQLMDAGRDLGLRHAGLKALGSLRMEKGYRDYGHDMDNMDNIYEVGLAFTCDFEKEGGFVGKDATLQFKPQQRNTRLLQVKLNDPEALMYHGEVVYRNGVVVGDIRAASYGHTLGGAVGLSMVKSNNEVINGKWISEAAWEVDVAGRRVEAIASLRPLFDPKSLRIKG